MYIAGKAECCQYSGAADSKLQAQHRITDERRGETVCRCHRRACPTRFGSSNSEPGTAPEQSPVQPFEKSKWSDCFTHGCMRKSCFDDADVR